MRKSERVDFYPAERAGGERQQRCRQRDPQIHPGFARGGGARTRRCARVAEMAPNEMILNDAERHEEARGSEAGAGTDELLRLARDDRPERRTDVDAHVEHGESRVEPGAALGVEFGHHGAHVRFQETDAQDDDEQAEIERPGAQRGRQDRITQCNSDAPDEHRVPRADQPIRDPPAGQRGEINARRVQPVDRHGGLVVDAEAALADGGDQEQNQDGAHAVVGEPFPHLGEEQGGEAARMPQKGRAHRSAHPTALMSPSSRRQTHGAELIKLPPRARRLPGRVRRSCPSAKVLPSRSLFRTGGTSAPPWRFAKPHRAA